MISLNVRNVHQALPEMLHQLGVHGIGMDSRYGSGVMFPTPVSTCFMKPKERVLFWKERDANPFFHFMEGLWMLDGRYDVEFLARFSSKISEFSDDGETFHGAYGYRWRTLFGMDQLVLISEALKIDPTCRRQVLQMWDCGYDLDRPGAKDLPCNTHVYFQRRTDGALNIMVCNRSNDLIWGAYGANAVHMSMLHEYMAARIGCDVGFYWQVSFNTHAYEAVVSKELLSLVRYTGDGFKDIGNSCPYASDVVSPYPMVNSPTREWDADLRMFLASNGAAVGLRDKFFRHVAVPMFETHVHWRNKEWDKAFARVKDIAATDWRLACREWLQRRKDGKTKSSPPE